MRKFQCLGKNSKGERCKNKFLTSPYDTKTLTCSLHKNQKVDFSYSALQNSCKMHDVAYIIAKEINDPKTFSSFAKVCLSTAKACHKLQGEKKTQFARPRIYYDIEILCLPNGDPL